MISARLLEVLEKIVDTREEHVVPGAAGGVPEDAREKSLADADGAQEDDVFVALDEAEAEEVADPVAIESDRRVPIEALEGLLFLEAGAFESVARPPGGCRAWVLMSSPSEYARTRFRSTRTQTDLRRYAAGIE
ncbi:MAG: hypothetical protein OZ922_02635 [Myxococcales bacterium]|nr:hypothetical protein [Myxococcales bacterium]